MEAVPLELADYIDEDYTILDDLYVRQMVLICGFDHYSFDYLYLDDANSIRDLDYISILNALLETKTRLPSYTMLIYTIVRYVHPHRKVAILYGAPEEEDRPTDLDLFYLSYDWNGEIPDGYVNICSADELMEFISNGNVWTIDDLIVAVPQIEDKIDEIMSNYITVSLMIANIEKYDISYDDAHFIIESISFIRQYPMYKKIFTLLPPYPCAQRSRRYIDRNSDVNFIFQ
jgi:hypothetical protein